VSVLGKDKSKLAALQHESIAYARSTLTLRGMVGAMEKLYLDLLGAGKGETA
jgi:hypothetical protein